MRETGSIFHQRSFYKTEWSNGLAVKALDSQSRGPVLKNTGWVEPRLSLPSFHEYQEFMRN